jgi:hypothetical protein
VDVEGPGDRVAELARAFAELAGGLANGYDVVDLLDRLVAHCVQLVRVDAAGLVLADAAGALRVMVATRISSSGVAGWNRSRKDCLRVAKAVVFSPTIAGDSAKMPCL